MAKAPPLPKNIVFDVGNVLLSWDPGKILDEHLPASADRKTWLDDIFTHPDWVELDRGTLDEEDAILGFAARTGASADLIRRIVHSSKTSLAPMQDSLALLEELHREFQREPKGGPRLFVLSNMSRTTWEYLSPRHDFWRRFEGIVISAQLRLVKPDRAIYQHLLKQWSLDPAQTLFMDDRPENVEAARALGIKSFVFTTAADARARLHDGRWRD